MSAGELEEHASYLSDATKMEAYRAGLASVVTPRSVVLDLGAGCGILGLIAAQLGARRVYAVDSGSIIGPAADVVAGTSMKDAFVHLQQASTKVELEDLVDVVVCDQIGGFVYDAGVLEFFADARRRLMKADAVCVPASFRLFLAPATCDHVREQIDLWGGSPEGIDFSVFRDLAVNSEYRVEARQVTLLAAGVQLAEVMADDDSNFVAAGHLAIEQPGRFDGVVGWFEADLGGGVTLSNHPALEKRMNRWCNFYPLPNEHDAVVGDLVDVEIDVRPTTYAATWRVAVRRDGAEGLRCRQSTLLGTFMSPKELRDRAAPPSSS